MKKSVGLTRAERTATRAAPEETAPYTVAPGGNPFSPSILPAPPPTHPVSG
jgi:hypothetical protein